MYISQETPAQTEARLRRVLAAADLHVYAEAYHFYETPVDEFSFDPRALALVRDRDVWSYLLPAPAEAAEPFTLFSFHFPADLDNSGFVGWLATVIKRRTGAGVFVVCGQNSARGGIFDYWGCPLAQTERVSRVIAQLRSSE